MSISKHFMNKYIFRIFLLTFELSISCFSILAQETSANFPNIRTHGFTKQLIVDEKPFIMLAGEVNNSSSSSLDFMEKSWERFSDFKLNTVLLPVSWEIIEPQEGQFDFSLVKGLILKAREHQLKLVFLWFGTWKNANSSYAPSWVRQNAKQFQRSETADGQKLNHISPFSSEACIADAKAFGEFMKFIKSIDEKEHTVIAIQVENESGIRKQERDFSKPANDAFNKKVPEKLIQYLMSHKKELVPEFTNIWANSDFKTEGTWTDIFGDNANLIFMAWNTAVYVDKVAAAGKEIYPLPMFVNAWLEWDDDNKPGDYPSGGPISRVIPVWKAAAPHIDVLSPDIYRDDFAEVCRKYQQMGNPLLIPETHPSVISAANVFYALGQGAMCFSPFGIDNRTWIPDDSPIGISYRFISQLMPYIEKYQGIGKMFGLLGKKGEKKEIELENYKLIVNFEGSTNPELPGFGIVFCLPDNDYMFAGKGFNVSFISTEKPLDRTEILSAHELVFADDVWKEQRRLNGDETDHGELIKMNGDSLTVKKARIFSYK